MELKNESLLSIDGLVTTIRKRGGAGNAVDDVRLEISRGETVGLVGESAAARA
jgi:ABC-type dipeptide/oligopeptide/nickel transport system ATPase component